MSSPLQDRDFQQRAQQMETLVQRVQSLSDENARALAIELMQTLMDLHSTALARVIELAVEGGEPGRAVLADICADPLITGLLVLYGLHPLEMEERIRGALQRIEPDLREQSASAEVLSTTDNIVRVRIRAEGHGCGSAGENVKRMVEQTIYGAAPEIVGIEVEGAATASAASFVPLAALQPQSKENTYEKPAA